MRGIGGIGPCRWTGLPAFGYQLEDGLLGGGEWLGAGGRWTSRVVFALDRRVHRACLVGIGHVPSVDGYVSTIDVQDGTTISQQVLRPVAGQPQAGADVQTTVQGGDPDDTSR